MMMTRLSAVVSECFQSKHWKYREGINGSLCLRSSNNPGKE